MIQSDCYDFNVERAKRDINERRMLLLYNGRANDLLSDSDKSFEKKYNVQYVYFTDEPMWSDCIRLYNQTIAHYLDEKYGPGWRKEVKKEIIIFYLSDFP